MVKTAVYAFYFLSFIFFWGGALGVMMILGAFVAAVEEIAVIRGRRIPLAVIALLRTARSVWH